MKNHTAVGLVEIEAAYDIFKIKQRDYSLSSSSIKKQVKSLPSGYQHHEPWLDWEQQLQWCRQTLDNFKIDILILFTHKAEMRPESKEGGSSLFRILKRKTCIL